MYTEFHPRWYRPHVSTWWWLGQKQYLKFILREISSVFVAWSVLLTLLLLRSLSAGPQAYAEFLEMLRNPLVVTLNAISFAFLLFHSITWFNLAPSAMPVRWRGRRLPDLAISVPNFAVWLLISAAIGWLLVR